MKTPGYPLLVVLAAAAASLLATAVTLNARYGRERTTCQAAVRESAVAASARVRLQRTLAALVNAGVVTDQVTVARHLLLLTRACGRGRLTPPPQYPVKATRYVLTIRAPAPALGSVLPCLAQASAETGFAVRVTRVQVRGGQVTVTCTVRVPPPFP